MGKFFVTAIGTDSGKTLVSTLLCKVLKYDYYKPIQAGTESTDKAFVKRFVTESTIFDESYCLQAPMSPHAAAELENTTIDLNKVALPNSENLIVEGAGGILVPINQKNTILDLIINFDIPVVLVSNFYLGSINHTLLTVNTLKQHNVKMKGIVFNGEHNQSSEDIILKMTGLKKLFAIDQETTIDDSFFKKYEKVVLKSF